MVWRPDVEGDVVSAAAGTNRGICFSPGTSGIKRNSEEQKK